MSEDEETQPTEEQTTSVIPDLRGRTAVDAGASLREARLRAVPGALLVDAEVPRGCVVASDPPAGTEVEHGSPVRLVFSLGSTAVWLQSFVDGPRDSFNQVALPPGEHVIDEPLRISRWRTRFLRTDKEGAVLWTLSGVDPVFVFDDDAVRGSRPASIVFNDDPGHELTSAGRVAIEGYRAEVG